MKPLMLAFALVLSAGAAEAKHHPCRGDRMKFCKDVKPGEGRVKACLNDHKADLSKKCSKAVDKYDEMQEEKK